MPDIVVVHARSLYPLGTLRTSMSAAQIEDRGQYEVWVPVLRAAELGAITDAPAETATAVANRVPLMRVACRRVVGPGGCEMVVLMADHARLVLELPNFTMSGDAQDALMRIAQRYTYEHADYNIAHAYGESPLHFLRRAYPAAMRVVENEWDAQMAGSVLSPYYHGGGFRLMGVDYARGEAERSAMWVGARNYNDRDERVSFQSFPRASRDPLPRPMTTFHVQEHAMTNMLASHDFAELEGRVLSELPDRMQQAADALAAEILGAALPGGAAFPVKREPPRVTTRVYSHVRRALDVGGG